LLHVDQDIDAMPIHQLENMPEVMRRCHVLVDGGHYPLLQDAKDHKLRVALSAGVAARAALNEQLEWPACNVIPFSQIFLNDLSKRAQVCHHQVACHISCLEFFLCGGSLMLLVLVMSFTV
jgi:hypothetical protein